MNILTFLNGYGWIIALLIIIKFFGDVLKAIKNKEKYRWTIISKIAIALIVFIVKFQVGEFFPINQEFYWPVKKFLLAKDPEGAKIIYNGLGRTMAGGNFVDFSYDMGKK